MGFTARKSFKVMPGVRMTVSKGGVSTSAGVKGVRVTRTASGRTTRTVGIPGSGLSHTNTISSSKAKSAHAPGPAAAPPAALSKPGFTAPKWEKELHKVITSGKFEELSRIGQTYPEAAGVAATLDGFVAMQNGDSGRALDLCRWAWSYGGAIDDHPFVRKYLAAGQVTIGVADGVSAALPLGRDVLGLALAELEQEAGNLPQAIAVVEQLDPSLIAALSLADLYIGASRYHDVVDLTNGMTNTDDPTALLVTFRGIWSRSAVSRCESSAT